MKQLLIFMAIILIPKFSSAENDVVESELIMGKGKLFVFMMNEYKLNMEACYDDGTNQIAIFTNNDSDWLHFNYITKIKSISILIDGKTSKINHEVKTLKFRQSNKGEESMTSFNIARVYKFEPGIKVEIIITLDLHGQLSKLSFKRDPFEYWQMRLNTNIK